VKSPNSQPIAKFIFRFVMFFSTRIADHWFCSASPSRPPCCRVFTFTCTLLSFSLPRFLAELSSALPDYRTSIVTFHFNESFCWLMANKGRKMIRLKRFVYAFMQLSAFVTYTWLLNDQTHTFSLSFWHVFFWLLNFYFKRNESETCCRLWSNIPSAECT